jgi:hypothetical protein
MGLALRLLFGFRKNVVATERFEPRFYEMIIAVPAQDIEFGELKLS